MSTALFPALTGLGWEVSRTPLWSSEVQEAVSGKETRIAYWSYPRWQWELRNGYLRSDLTNAEYQTLTGFFNARQGRFDTWLYQDAEDKSVAGQTIGTGNGSTTAFQLVRPFGGFVEPILAPNVVSAVYVNSVLQGGGTYSVSPWGSTTPGVLTFNTAPTGTITADFTYYFPCRFLDDEMTLNRFLNQLWSGDRITFRSVK